MTRTGGQLIGGALRLIGQQAAGEPLNSSDGPIGLDVLNELVDAWAAERLTLFAQAITACTLSAAKQTYTVGASGADWTLDRPFWIDHAIRREVATGIERPIKVYEPSEWSGVTLKTLAGPMPIGIHYNPTFPLGQADVWPIPTGNTYSIVLYTPAQALQSVASLNTSISMPQGWQRALRYNLALALAAEYGFPIDQSVIAIAADSKATIKRTSESPEVSQLDPAVLGGRGAATINRATGEVI